jgi:hypothetical protein
MTDTYKMTVDFNVLDHLGINLYSNIAAALTEADANAWDADAEKVDIRIDPDGKWDEIANDGVGMSIADMINVHSAKDGETNGLGMTVSGSTQRTSQ